MFGSRPTFGSGASTFGNFGANTTSGFGSSAFGRPAFGTPQTTAASPFGSNTSTGTTSLFGQTQNPSGGLFGSTTQTGFGSTSNTFGSGGGLFGTSTQPNTSGGLFGSASTSTGFNANQNQSRPFSFGTPTTSAGTSGGGLFGSSSTSGSLFGSAVGQQQGTIVKYNPVTGTDTMTRGGVTQSIQTKIEVITAMKEYESKSLEELRVDDYLFGRKGPSQGSTGFGFNQNKFGMNQQSSGWLSNTSQSGGGLFGTKPAESKPLFGSGTSTGFGASTSGGLFGSSPSPFGQPTTTSSAGFTFGQSSQAKPGGFSFNQTTPSSIFGTSNTATQSGTNFGSGFNFGSSPNQTAGGLFGNQNKSVFGPTSTGSTLFGSKPSGTGFGGFGTQPTTSPFGTTSTTGGTGLFGTQNQNKSGFSLGTGSTGFGTNTAAFGTGSLFGSSATQKPGGLTFGSSGGFGTGTSSGFNFSQPSGGTGGLFGNTGSTGGGLFGNTNTNLNAGSFGTSLGSGFGMSSLQPNTMNNMNNNVINNNIANLIKALTHNPFGSSSLLKNTAPPTGKADELLNSPTESSSGGSGDANKSSTSKKPTYVLPAGSGNASKPRPVGLNRTINGYSSDYDVTKSILFSGLEDRNDSFSEDPFKLKPFPSVKKLNLRVFNTSKSDSTGQSTTSSSVINENINSDVPTPLTTPVTSPNALETPNRHSASPSQDNSPTPDIIKGRNNIKKLNIPNKNHPDDTLGDLNIVHKTTSTGISSIPSPDLDQSITNIEANKDNSLSICEVTNVDDIPEVHNLSSVNSHPAGLKLHRAGYYTIPSMEDLTDMVDEDGSCLVENFTVGRYGYGNICFQGITNVANLDLDSIVFIVRKEVEVYPEGTEKPNIGDALNKPSYVTLDCVWPVDKSNHEVIKSQERLDAMGWSEHLERQCIKMDATFVEYRPETGSWVFKVKHFSKYGLEDDTEDVPATAGGAASCETVNARGKENIPPSNVPSEAISGTGTNIPSQIIANKVSLPVTTYPGTVPLFNSRNSAGPPALGLLSPSANATFPQITSETVITTGKRKVLYLDGSTAEEQEKHTFGDTFINSLDETDMICPLSPSTERLTISSRATHRAIQNLTSQLFFGDFEDEFACDQNQKGAKRDVADYTDVTVENSFRSAKDSSVFALKGSAKKLLIEPELEAEYAIPEVIFHQPLLSKESRQPKSPFAVAGDEDQEMIVLKETVTPLLRDAKSEYHLLPSGRDLDADSERNVTHHLSSKIPMESSLALNGKGCISDAAAFMSRSFRVGWGPGWTLVHAGDPLGTTSHFVTSDNDTQRMEDDASMPLLLLGTGVPSHRLQVTLKKAQRRTLRIEKLCLGNKEKATTAVIKLDSLLEACMQNVLECSVISSQETDFDCPSFSPKKGISLLHRLTVTATQVEDSENRDQRMSSVFNLCVALWGNLDFYSPELDGDSEYARAQARKEAVSLWLEEVSRAAVADETERALSLDDEDAYLDAVFSHLTVRQISEAGNLAQDKGDHHLTLLLSQVCLGDETPRQIMSQQLSSWAWAKLDEFISTPRLTLYSLLGGKPTHEASHTKINTCAGLDWRRAFAVHMWYICPTISTIAEVLLEYDKAAGLHLNKDNVYCEEPKPPYVDPAFLPENAKVNHDVCYQLLKLFVDPSHPLDSLLQTSSHSPDPIDVTMSWLLWCILQSLDYAHIPQSKIETLHTSMAALLEASGQWHWAAFVILCITDKKKQRNDLSELLNRHLLTEGEESREDPFYREKEHFLLKYLKLPEKWLHRAKAVRAKSLKMVDEEAWYLIQAGEYNSAHALIVDAIAPNAVINEDHEHLQSYLDEFRDEKIRNQVVDWASGGGIYVNYLEVIRQVEELKRSRKPTGPKVEKLRPRLLALCARLNNLKCPTPVHRLSISEMSRMVVSVLRAVVGGEPDGVRVLAQQVSALPLAHECALEELNQITHQYLTQVAMET